jgi:16S rRNA (guanine966-N2)-methyltransferase
MADAGRVIAGTARGIRLTAPGPGTRPLGDRVKQTLFAVLEPELPGASVLDLYAGSGAAGIEALSRGAKRVVFIEKDASAVRVIEENLSRTGLAGPGARVVRADALAWLEGQRAESERFDFAIVDPPYAETDLLERTLVRLGGLESHALAPGARVIAKHFWRNRPPGRIGLLASERERRFGETALTFFRRIQDEAGKEGE